VGILILCEVALGDTANLVRADYHADRLPPGKLSTLGMGSTTHDTTQTHTTADGMVVPCGPLVSRSAASGATSLLYDEYIVYNVAQVRMKFMVVVDFKF
jgi:poly [ADP-ribose] polymerase